MNIEKLEYLGEIAKTGSISIASQNLHVSQSGISQSIANLEAELGIKIFKRSPGHGAVPTVEGKQIIMIAQEILMKYQELKEKAKSFTSLTTGELKISAVPGFLTLLIKPLQEYKKVYPNVNAEISEKTVQEIMDDVQQNKIDIGLIPYVKELFEKSDNLAYETLLEGEMKVFVSKNSPLTLHDRVTPKQLLNQTFVLYNGENVKWFASDFFNEYKHVNILFRSNNPEAIYKAVAGGSAITFAPDISPVSNPFSLNGEVVPLKIVDYKPVTLSFGLVRSEKKHCSTAVKEFINYFKFENQIK